MNNLIKNILVSLGETDRSTLTIKYAVCLAKVFKARLHAIYAVDTKSLKELLAARVLVEVEAMGLEVDLEEQGRGCLSCMEKLAQAKGIKLYPILTKGTVHQEVINKINELNIDLLLTGELKPVISRVDALYDETEQIVRGAPCPVLVVKNPPAVERMYEDLE